ncbi:hypothetical protein [Streptomyces sp. NPDC048636]|uniref:hypothetical protein n=1 Tax=Streptomyces sp. NPDC048636 TaxID=3155762 RepID=UPI003444A36F
MGGAGRLRVPVGADAGRWVTRAGCRRVLFVVHNVTSATRLLDVLPLFHSDLRVQMFATCTGSSPFLAGVPELLAEAGLPVLPWEQAKDTTFDLVLSASYGGELEALRGELVILSHGVGYNKRLATPDTGHRTPDTGHRTPAPLFGMSPEWLLKDGRPIATATVLSHPEQLERLSTSCPEAVSTAVLAGDPCHDRILAALSQRDRFRRALGVAPGQRLIVISSTWSPRSLFGGTTAETETGPREEGDRLYWLLSRLASELPVDEYRTAAVLHPNIWYGHGAGQVRAWLDTARRAGLSVIDPLEGWRQALIAADCVVGDHGSVTYYAASIDTPILLGAFPQEDLDPRSPVAALGRTAPRLLRRGGLREQIERAIVDHKPGMYEELAAQTNSSPGESALLLRRLCYELLGISQPDSHPALLDPLPLPPYEPGRRTAPVQVLTRVTGSDPAQVTVVRFAGSDGEPGPTEDDAALLDAGHTVVDEDTRDVGRLRIADVVVRRGSADDPRIGPPTAWTSEALARYPHCGLAAYVDGTDRCVVRTRGGTVIRLTAGADPEGRPDLCDPAVYASALYAWITGGGNSPRIPQEIIVRTGATTHRASLEPLAPPPRR